MHLFSFFFRQSHFPQCDVNQDSTLASAIHRQTIALVHNVASTEDEPWPHPCVEQLSTCVVLHTARQSCGQVKQQASHMYPNHSTLFVVIVKRLFISLSISQHPSIGNTLWPVSEHVVGSTISTTIPTTISDPKIGNICDVFGAQGACFVESCFPIGFQGS